MNGASYIFDVDGVVTNPVTHEADARVLKQISELIDNGSYIALNTGSGYPRVKDKMINVIRNQIAHEKLDQVFVSAEMGGLTVEFKNSQEQDNRTAFSLLPEQIEQVKQLFLTMPENKNIAWYQGKLSMATILRPPGADEKIFIDLAKQITSIIEEMFKSERVKIKLNPDAIDVMTPEAGKWAGAQLIADWLQKTPAADTKHFVCFGDNASDYEMARFFAHQGHKVEFVFVGKELDELTPDSSVIITKTRKHYNEGTYEYLASVLG